jgi:hypothetical protein
MMYDWSSRKKNVWLITGHIHRPVFASGKYTLNDTHKIDSSENSNKIKPTYFNTGCCCYYDGDITGIEITDGFIRLVKWHSENNVRQRIILEERTLQNILKDCL